MSEMTLAQALADYRDSVSERMKLYRLLGLMKDKLEGLEVIAPHLERRIYKLEQSQASPPDTGPDTSGQTGPGSPTTTASRWDALGAHIARPIQPLPPSDPPTQDGGLVVQKLECAHWSPRLHIELTPRDSVNWPEFSEIKIVCDCGASWWFAKIAVLAAAPATSTLAKVESPSSAASFMTGQEEQPATTYELASRGLIEYRARDGTHYWATPHDAGKLMALMAKEPSKVGWPLTSGESRHSGAMP